MKERPLPFQPSMVRATLRDVDPKLQTRRCNGLEKLSPDMEFLGFGTVVSDGRLVACFQSRAVVEKTTVAYIPCPYGKPGDQLWVRESWRVLHDWDAFKPSLISPTTPVLYEADAKPSPHAGRLRPPMFMPRWASRIQLEVTDVRVERLQSISEADARAEGAESMDPALKWNPPELAAEYWPLSEASSPHRNGYALLWESINGPGSWDANSWVWVVGFRRIKP